MKFKLYPCSISVSAICKSVFTLMLLLCMQNAFAQNSCATAMTVVPGTYTVTVIDGANSTTGCSGASAAEWYVYTPTQNRSVTITSDLPVNACGDTNVNVYTGTCSGLTCYAGDDDSGTVACTSSGTTYLSTETFDAFAGTTYYIAWDNKWSNAGFQWQLSEAPYVPSPCLTSIPVAAGLTVVNAIDGNNINTTCSTATSAKWYSYTPSQYYHVTVTSDLPQNICKDTNFSVYTGSCSSGLTCVTTDDNSGIIACDSGNTSSNLSKKSFDVNPGVTYYIVWDNKWSAAGFDFQIIEDVIVVPVSYTTQAITTVNSTYNMCVVDMNGDGLDDIAGVSNNNLRINYQGAGGTFTHTDFPISGSSQMPSWSIAAGDYNKDGYNDLLLGSGGGLTFWKSNATGTGYTSITPGQYIFCQRTNFVDINHDGNLDAFSCHDVAPNVYYMNDGSGNFTYYQSTVTTGAYDFSGASPGGNYASLWTDLDNDGDTDLFVSKCSGPPCEIHRNDGATFTDISAQAGINFTPVQSWSSAVADFDNDGDMDILVGSNGSVGSRLFRNNLDTSNSTEEAYTNITAGSGWESASTNRDYVAYDFDNDGFVDVLAGGNRIMFNNGDATFQPTTYSGMSVGAVGDLNNDGFLDILNGSTVRYAVPNSNHWLAVTLEGIQSNSNGIGARVEIHGPWGIQIRDIRSGEGFGYMSTLNAHFGLGTATNIETVVIKWPSGVVDVISNPSPDQRITVVEGSSPLSTNDVNPNSFTLYPNPANDLLSIRLGSGISDIKAAEIYDLAGRLIARPEVSQNTISVKQLASGNYILLLESANGKRFTQRFLKN
ncbi:MAG: T9SS type A sorting domain-containing protein [Flavobacterium sp.]|nr:MAG: T9SS type A sorting domain-containing protein [Flavobacterium sp.]